MAETKLISLQEVAERAGVSLSLLHHYRRKGLLPLPHYISNIKVGRGTLAKYPEGIVDFIKKIQEKLTQTHSLEQVKKELVELYAPEKKRNQVISEKARRLEALAKQGHCGSREYKELVNFFRVTSSTPLAVYFQTL